MDLVGFIRTSLLFISIMGGAMWMGVLWKAEGEEQLVDACRPFAFATDMQHRLISGIVGYEPAWTLQVYRFVVGNCYYVTSRIALTQRALSDDGTYLSGGVRMY